MSDLTPRKPYRPLIWTDAVRDIQDLLHDEDAPVYIVGGAVRDALLSRPIKDLDLATPGDSTAIARKIANTLPNGALFIMDQERGVARAIIETMHGKMNVDVARFRGDESDILADVTDRDFTINAMMVDLKGDLSLLIDPLNGERDAAEKRIRRCNPDSVSSDPIRALRAIRQSTQLGFRIDADTLADVRAAAPLIARVSAERVRDELFNIFNLPRPSAALRVMHQINLLDAVVPVTAAEEAFATIDRMSGFVQGIIPGNTDTLTPDFSYGMALMQLNRVRKQLADHLLRVWAAQREHRALLMLLALVQELPPEQVALQADTLRLSNDEKKRLIAAADARATVMAMPELTPLIQHRFWYALDDAGVDVCLLTLANYLAEQGVHIQQTPWLQVVDRVRALLETYYLAYDEIVAPPPLVSGRDLMDGLNLEPGKHIGVLLDALREAQVTGEVQTVDDALQFARAALD